MAGMAAGAITIQVDADGGALDEEGVPLGVYRLVGPNGEEGGITDFGIPAILTIGNERYMAFIDVDGLPDEDLGPAAYLIKEVQTVAVDVTLETSDAGEPDAEATDGEPDGEEGDEGDEDEEDDGEDEDDEDGDGGVAIPA
jgi:hypothetical protein